jgi:hypothetical protein
MLRYPLLSICNLVALKLRDALGNDPDIVYLLSFQQLFARILWNFHLKFKPLLPLLRAKEDSSDSLQHLALNEAFGVEGLACVWLRPKLFDPTVTEPAALLPSWLTEFHHDHSAVNLLSSTSHVPFFAAELEATTISHARASRLYKSLDKMRCFILINKKEFHIYQPIFNGATDTLYRARYEFNHFTFAVYTAVDMQITRRSKSAHPHGHVAAEKKKKCDEALQFDHASDLARVMAVLVKMKRFLSQEDYHIVGL